MDSRGWWRDKVISIADRLVYSSKAYVDLKSTINELSESCVRLSGNTPLDRIDERAQAFVSAIRPYTGINVSLVRVGGNSDGGYVMADDFEVDGAISVGVGRDVTWDQAIADKGVRVAMFDPTVRKLPAPVTSGTFFRYGVGPPMNSRRYRSLPELVEMAGFESNAELLLKIDVEGAEWTALGALDGADLLRFRQIVIEIHGLESLSNESSGSTILHLIEKLALNHTPIHVHANNYSRLICFGSVWLPDVMEISYLRRDIIRDPRLATSLRTDLDRPCDPRVSEISLEGLLPGD